MSRDLHLVRYDPGLVISFARASGDERLADLIGRRLVRGGGQGSPPDCLRPIQSRLATRTLGTLVRVLGLDRHEG